MKAVLDEDGKVCCPFCGNEHVHFDNSRTAGDDPFEDNETHHIPLVCEDDASHKFDLTVFSHGGWINLVLTKVGRIPL